MRDWLALPLSPTSPSTSVKNSDDEYDIVNSRATTDEEIEEEDVEESTWVTLLNALVGVDGKQQQQIKSRSVSSSSSSCSAALTPKNSIKEQDIKDLDVKESTHKQLNSSKIVCNEISVGEMTDEEYNHHDDYYTIENDDDQHDNIGLKRTLSNSSLASSTDTDNSTPASSQIMRPSSSKFFNNMSTTNKTLVEICWNHGGKKVQVTGEFDNWSVSVDMVQDTENTNRHVAMIPMDSTKDIEFKFIVDGEWKFAMDLPHRTDWRGNVNNVVYRKNSS